jgi:predicted NUDIX family NTP pyrophosphohydrolase
MAKVSCGLLMYRIKNGHKEFFLVHPGGPFFKNKDDGVWSLPKGEPEKDEEDYLQVAQREFEEETSIKPYGPYKELGTVKQKSGKIIYAWAFEGDWPDDKPIKSNTFMLEWPPKSGKKIEIPEVDRGEWYEYEIALRKVYQAQQELIKKCNEMAMG